MTKTMSFPQNYLLMLALILMAMHRSPAESLTLADGPVIITNKISGTLTIHCWSEAGKDLGVQHKGYNEDFSWYVSLVIGKPNEVYNCDLSSGGLRGRFNLFDGNRDFAKERCGLKDFRCVWQVTPDGIYLQHNDSHNFDLQYRWP